jgi:hypothetical protein
MSIARLIRQQVSDTSFRLAASPRPAWFGGRGVPRCGAHACRNFGRHPVVAQHAFHIAQSAGLALHDELPKRHAGPFDQRRPQRASFGRRLRTLAVKLEKGRQRGFERASLPPQRRRSFLGEFVLDEIGGPGIDRSLGRVRFTLEATRQWEL